MAKKLSVNIEVIDDEQWLISIKSGREVIGKKSFKECPSKVELEKYIEECKEKQDKKHCPKCNKEMIHHEAGSRKNIEEAGGKTVKWKETYFCSKCNRAYDKDGKLTSLLTT